MKDSTHILSKTGIYTLVKSDTIKETKYQTIVNNFLPERTEKQLFSISLDVWQLIIPVISFILGFMISSISSLISKKLEIKRKLNGNKMFIETWIDLIQQPLQDQLSSLDTFISSLDEEEFPVLKQTALHIEKFKVINEVDYVNLFITNNKREHGSDILLKFSRNIEYLLHVLNYMRNDFDLYQNAYRQYQKENNEAILNNDDSRRFHARGEIKKTRDQAKERFVSLREKIHENKDELVKIKDEIKNITFKFFIYLE